ncbi:MAG: hypothetical protein ACOCT9_00275 [archaeon]
MHKVKKGEIISREKQKVKTPEGVVEIHYKTEVEKIKKIPNLREDLHLMLYQANEKAVEELEASYNFNNEDPDEAQLKVISKVVDNLIDILDEKEYEINGKVEELEEFEFLESEDDLNE